MTRIIRPLLASAVALPLLVSVVQAQETQDQQRFQVRVPGLVAINATNSLAEMEHDLTEANQTFEWQPWQVTCNNVAGAIATFETDQAFTHTTNASVKRDAFLFLSNASGSIFLASDDWRVTHFADETDYKMGDGVAMVTAEVTGASDGKFLLRVVYLEENLAETIAGDYELTVIGTITPK
ncbi:hypothetical protein EC9_15080 [Rosistilla ulvae]|uniref:Uncharacterized protein n=1 Tax=Rosistilla ulvae TaxID=1930277 RepID=A0A517LXI8_9BACT|nr:hypothetical protein [Rosistilla ulvae]QDS87330.1 hypothetical protein EC9_15080 [Rosistilla ulvae]